MPLALLALAIGAFGIGTTEFVILGLLPEVAGTFEVSITTAGLLVSGYAVGVLLGAPLMTVLGTRVSRKRMLILLMALFVLGNALTALAPAFGVILLGRVVASFTHGAFFGIGSVVAADLVAPEKKAAAISTMFAGLTLANVLGVPLGTLIGQTVSWRLTFLIVAALGVLGAVGIARLVPEQAKPEGVRLRHELAVFRNVQVLLAMGMTVLGFGGVFAALTYVKPMMTDVAGFSEGAVTWLLAVVGLGMLVGNAVGGRLADRHLMPLLYGSLLALAGVLALFTVTAHDKTASVITLFLIGALGFATVPPLQKRVMDNAAGAPTLAAAVNIGAFNLGNAIAAWLGGLVIDAGHGYESANWVGAALALGALALAVLAHGLERRALTRSRVVAAHPPGVRTVLSGQSGQGDSGAADRTAEQPARLLG
ncbi:MFS transporter [Embleya scabrispora]|uniref:MFS transporter n=1 Tax=Embleya scabrispora TaxID=159449 RepID=UPI0003772BDC|nr:MFS transporter [Embleya scabrispora]MYS83091.1 MFS transporter [Streptomyces sp. SID5474]